MSRWISTSLIVALIALGGLAVGTAAFADGADVVTGSQAQELVADGAVLVDVRTPQEFNAGHIEGAINIPLHELRQRIDELGSPDEPIVLYCRSGNRSHQAEVYLEGQGFENVYDLGSYRNW
jgi:phage shock protein E